MKLPCQYVNKGKKHKKTRYFGCLLYLLYYSININLRLY